MHWRKSPFLRHLLVRPRLGISAFAGILVYVAWPWPSASLIATRFLISWNVTVCLYLALASVMMATSTPEKIQGRAIAQDEGAKAVLVLVAIAVAASLLAIVVELSLVRGLTPPERGGHIALTAVTVVTSWLFTHLMFALHYAHDYFRNVGARQPTGIVFPGEEAPDYGDFLYLAGVIGTSGQTADVSFTNRTMRRTALAHCVLAFFFNTTVLALTINIAASLLQA